jgi:hypothetical protein
LTLCASWGVAEAAPVTPNNKITPNDSVIIDVPQLVEPLLPCPGDLIRTQDGCMCPGGTFRAGTACIPEGAQETPSEQTAPSSDRPKKRTTTTRTIVTPNNETPLPSCASTTPASIRVHRTDCRPQTITALRTFPVDQSAERAAGQSWRPAHASRSLLQACDNPPLAQQRLR